VLVSNHPTSDDDCRSQAERLEGDVALARRILAGEQAAVTEFLGEHQAALNGYLRSNARNGREQAIAEDVAATVLHLSCLPSGSAHADEKLSLARYSGTGKLRAWLARTAMFRFLNELRRKQVRVTTIFSDLDGETDFEAKLRAPDGFPEIEGEWIDVIREAMSGAMRRAGLEHPEGFVFLRLVHVHGVQRQVLAKLWHRHPAQVTRWMEECSEKIRTLTLDGLRALDEHFELQWEDLIRAIANSSGTGPEEKR